MFKSKLNFKVFDKRDRSTPHLTTVEMKNRARACCGKLSNRLGETTPFHLILDYFDDQPGEPKGHFIDFGKHTTLQKHFEKVETKAGGKQERFSESMKQVATGVAFVQEKGRQQVVYLVPLQSKIPTNGWNKFLKKAKPIFGNRPGVMLTQEEWKAMQEVTAQEEQPNFERQLSQLKQALELLSTDQESLSKEVLQRQLSQQKATLQQLIQQYKEDKDNKKQAPLQEVIDLWKSLATTTQ